MTRLRVFLCRLSGLFRKGSLERDMDEELDFHLQLEIAENLRQGMTPQEARSAALRRFGGVAQIKEIYRETHTLPAIQVLSQDVRYGFRMLRRNPGFSALAILCLTLGIGANASVFSWIEGILLRPFPLVAHQERMMAVAGNESRRVRPYRRFLARLRGSSEELHAVRRLHRGPDHRDHAQHRRPRRAHPRPAWCRPTISTRWESIRSWGAGSSRWKTSGEMPIP